MKDSVSQFGSQRGQEIIKSFKEVRLQESLGSGVISVPLEAEVLESRMKVWDSSSYGLSNKLSEQLKRVLEGIATQSPIQELDQEVNSIELAEDSDLEGCFVESLGSKSTLKLEVSSSVGVYKCRSLQELALADYVLKFKVSCKLSETDMLHWMGIEDEAVVPVLFLDEEANGSRSSSLLNHFLTRTKPVGGDTAKAIYDVFCGFRLIPGVSSKGEPLSEILNYKGKRVLLAGVESFRLEHYARALEWIHLVQGGSKSSFEQFVAVLRDWEHEHLSADNHTWHLASPSMHWCYALIDQSMKVSSLFTADNKSALGKSHLASMPLKNWLAD